MNIELNKVKHSVCKYLNKPESTSHAFTILATLAVWTMGYAVGDHNATLFFIHAIQGGGA